MDGNYKIQWSKDLDGYIKIFGSFIFEGGIHDYYPFKKDDQYLYCSLEENIARKLKNDYCIVFFDHEKQCVRKIVEGCNENTCKPETSAENPFNSFEFYHDESFSKDDEKKDPNIELFKEYFTDKYLQDKCLTESKKSQADLSVDVKRIRDVLAEFDEKRKQEKYKDCKPFLFILKNVSRIMTTPGSPKEDEHIVLMELFSATQIESPCRVMLLVDKINDLPTWFEAENTNSAVKKIYLPTPDSEFRKAFFVNELQSVMVLDANPKKSQDLISKFAAFTEGFSLRRLIQLRNFIKENIDDERVKQVKYINETVMKFNVGVQKDPWKDEDLRKTVSELVDKIKESGISGQDHVLEAIQKQLRSAVTGVNRTNENDRRPKAIFFLAGPTGTGKTEVTKCLTTNFFGSVDSMVRFDMSEFKDDHTDSRLFGAPPGYVGYESGGELTKAVKSNPFRVILFDEIEKASPRIWDKFLQILGDGRLTDGKGETVYFSQSIIVFTSNLGITATENLTDEGKDNVRMEISGAEQEVTEAIKNCDPNSQEFKKGIEILKKLTDKSATSLGLSIATKSRAYFSYWKELGYCDLDEMFNKFVNETVKSRIETYFENIGRREVLGRIGKENILVYNFINEEIAKNIAAGRIKKFVKYVKEENEAQLDLTISDAARDYIYELVVDPEVLDLGGRGIVTCADDKLSKAVSEFIFDNPEPGLKAELLFSDISELYCKKID